MGFAVVLEHPLKDEDAEALITAIRQLRGVVDVQPIVEQLEHQMLRWRVRHELLKEVQNLILERTR